MNNNHLKTKQPAHYYTTPYNRYYPTTAIKAAGYRIPV
jgi:hypothetical protein